jgi:hypothetical protein
MLIWKWASLRIVPPCGTEGGAYHLEFIFIREVPFEYPCTLDTASYLVINK